MARRDRHFIFRAGLTLATLAAMADWGNSGVLLGQQMRWRSGADFHRQLSAPVGISWSENPLRKALDSLARSQRVAIFLDRRVDPGQRIEFSASNVPLETLLEDLARKLNLQTVVLENVVYLGPVSGANKLATLAEVRQQEARNFPQGPRSRLVKSERSSWDELSTPQEILQRVADDGGVRFVDLEKIPHDLWPAADLPPLSFANRFSLLLIGFDMTFQWAKDGSAMRPRSLVGVERTKRTYTATQGADRMAAALRDKFPDVKFLANGRELEVEGSFADHHAVARLLKGKKTRRPPATTTAGNADFKRLKIEKLEFTNQPVGAVVKALAARLKLQWKVDPALAEKLNKRTSLKVENVTYEELFAAVLKPAGLTFELRGKELILLPKEQ